MTEPEELVQRARDLVPKLRERAAETERQRRPLAENVEALKVAELTKVAQPARFGGLGLDFSVAFDISAELGRGCGSTAWCHAIWSSHNWILGMFPEQAQEEYWADSADTLSSTSLNPAGAQVTQVEEGYQLSGQWDFSSGCDASSWVLLVGIGPCGPLMFLLPRSDYAIEDTWFVSGLRGTGSKDIRVENVFVPNHRTLSMQDMREARTPGRIIHDTPNYRIPLRSILSFILAAPVVGMAQGTIEAFESYLRGRISMSSGDRMAEFAGIQMRLAESEAEVRAARLLMRHDAQEMFARARQNEMPNLEERARYRRDQAYVARLCLQAVNRLFEAGGGHALYDSSALQRFHRDTHAACHHVSLYWDSVAVQYGQVRLGQEPSSPDL